MTAIITVGFALLGLAVGSFLNLCIDRLPQGKSIVRPGSHCDNCNQSLKAVDLVPVFSYLWLRGRCRYCGARIPLRSPIVEFATAAIFAFLAWHYGLSRELAFAVIYAGIFIVIFAIDLEQELILNIVVFPAMVLAFAFSFFWGGFEEFWPKVGPGFVLSALMGGAVGFVLMLLPYLLTRGRGMGYGDVKLAAFIGLMSGFPLVLVALLVGIVVGGLAAVILLVSRAVKSRKAAIPYGPFLAVGAMVALIWGDKIFHWWWSVGSR
jgi:leader peptidase (prepilin peptidase) / N-methyltransferase